MTVARSRKADSTWKDHPVIIVIIAGAAVAAFMVSVVFPMLTTIQSQKLEAAIQRLQDNREKINYLRGSLNSASSSLRVASKELRSRGEELRSLRLGAMFDPVSPLPYGWRAVPLGSEKSLIEERYPGRKIDKEDKMVTVSGDGAPFDRATFYTSDDGLVKYARFSHYKYEMVDGDVVNISKNVVARKLKDTFGEPDIAKKDNLCWLGRNGVDFVHDSFALMVFPAGQYVLNECGSENEVMAARYKALNCPVPKEIQDGITKGRSY